MGKIKVTLGDVRGFALEHGRHDRGVAERQWELANGTPGEPKVTLAMHLEDAYATPLLEAWDADDFADWIELLAGARPEREALDWLMGFYGDAYDAAYFGGQ